MTNSLGRGAMAIGVSALLASVLGCGRDAESPPIWTEPKALNSLTRSWVGGTATEVLLIQITQDGAELTGTLNSTELKASSRLDVDQAAFTGTTRSGSITLTFAAGLGIQQSISGTVSEDSMVLNVPNRSGSMESYALKPGSIEQYNTRVADLQAQADSTGGNA
ncbi:hypothetical protein [Streptomyces albipurpureus]|uniref:Lipoprotein n=1 Tax=Streptomyces albipurpureus TaxID=2897419 RepID=A0ABT0UG28_9ACTN|nr:hypothetical protein [Streptomyces sp. CWNU-1]MCM2386964.1 hypothetical protein [Streptomyces sp. CWNU-1]